MTTLAFIDLDFIIIIFWIMVFLAPLLKTLLKKKSVDTSSENYYPQSSDDYTQDEFEDDEEDEELFQEGKPSRSLEDIFASLSSNKSNNVTPPPIVDVKVEPSTHRSRKSKISEKIDAINLSDKTKADADVAKTRYGITSKSDLKRAFVWSEVLQRKYN